MPSRLRIDSTDLVRQVNGEPEPSAAAAAQRIQPPPAPGPDQQVEQWSPSNPEPSLAGKALRECYGEALARIPVGGKAQLEMDAKVRLKYMAESECKVQVERTEEGRYEVTVGGRAAVGVGSKTEKSSASATAGLHAGATLVFATPGEAAAFLADLTEGAALQAANRPLLELAASGLGLVDRNGAQVRVTTRARENLARAEVGVSARLKAETDLVFAKLGVTGEGAATVRVDLEQGKLVYEQVGRVKGEGKAKMPSFGPLTLESGIGAAELEGRIITRAELAVSKEDLRRISNGELDARTLLDPTRLELSVTQEVTCTLAGANFKASRPLPPFTLPTDYSGGDWTVKAHMTLPKKALTQLDSGAVAWKLAVGYEHPLALPRTGTGTLAQALQEVGAASGREQDAALKLEAVRAAQRAR